MLNLKDIFLAFTFDGTFLDAERYGTGHINDTYVARVQTDAGIVRFILQRINHLIFKNPEKLMENIDRVTRHLQKKLSEKGGDPSRRSLTLVPTSDGAVFHRDGDGNYWRTYVFVEGAQTYDLVENLDHVYAASRAFGEFQAMITDIPGDRLHETIPHFHHTQKRFETFVQMLEKDPLNRAIKVKKEIDFVLKREADAGVLVGLVEADSSLERITHNDTKLNNVMIDDKTGEGLCVIDLDTVMPGLAMYDFGDSVRVGASTALEDEQDLSKVHMDLDMFERLSHGYLDAARSFLTSVEIDHLAFSAKMMTYECGMRFLTDHIDGDHYFKVHRDNHNLDRCRTQFQMVAEMETQMDDMRSIVEQYAKG